MARSRFYRPIPFGTTVALSRPVAQDTNQFYAAPSIFPPPEVSDLAIIGTTQGPPTSGGPYQQGQLYFDTTNVLYVCTLGGSPGTWSLVANNQPWTTYTPTIGGTGFTLGNGTISGWYRMIDVKTVGWQVQLGIGSTTVIGTGPVRINPPAGTGFKEETWTPGRWYATASGVFYPVGLDSGAIYQPNGTTSSQLETLTSGSTLLPSSGDDYIFNGLFQTT